MFGEWGFDDLSALTQNKEALVAHPEVATPETREWIIKDLVATHRFLDHCFSGVAAGPATTQDLEVTGLYSLVSVVVSPRPLAPSPSAMGRYSPMSEGDRHPCPC